MPTTIDCTAFGYSSPSSGITATLAEHWEKWNGKAWFLQTLPPVVDGRLAGLSCARPASCTAVTACTAAGYFNAHVGTKTLADHS